MRTNLRDDPAVIQMAGDLGLDRDTVVGKLHRFWSWAYEQLPESGRTEALSYSFVDALVEHVGFAKNLEKQKWLRSYKNGFAVPNFDHWFTETAKSRLFKNRRQARHRSRNGATGSGASATTTRPDLTRPDKTIHNRTVPTAVPAVQVAADGGGVREPVEGRIRSADEASAWASSVYAGWLAITRLATEASIDSRRVGPWRTFAGKLAKHPDRDRWLQELNAHAEDVRLGYPDPMSRVRIFQTKINEIADLAGLASRRPR